MRMRGVVSIGFLITMMLGPWVNGGAQESSADIQVIVNMVQLNVAVTDNKGDYVTGLKPEDFLVTEDGIPQKIASFGEGNERSRRIEDPAEAKTPTPGPSTQSDAMLPDADPSVVWKQAAGSKQERVMVVGHEPHLGHLISFLLGNEIAVDFRKGGLIRIDVKGRGMPGGLLKWALTPRLARA